MSLSVLAESVSGHAAGGVSSRLSSREAAVGQNGGRGPEKPARAPEPLPGSSAAATEWSGVRDPPQDQCPVAAAGPHGTAHSLTL